MVDRIPSPSELLDADGERLRLAALLALCVVGLVIAALATPPVNAGGPGVGVGVGGGGGGSGGGSSGSGGDGVGLDDLLRFFLPTDGSDSSESACRIELSREPVPGRSITVRVTADYEPVTDARVSFNGEPVGRTDGEGEVRGQVPYERRLVVTVQLAEGVCRATAGGRAGEAPSSLAVATSGLRAGTGGHARTDDPTATDGHAGTDGDNVTESYRVRGEVHVEVEGTPFPGERIELRTSIRDEPVSDATVTVDGERVGRTDADGRYELRVPDDGTETLTVEVARGEFSGTARIPVALLSVAVRPDGWFAIPTRPAAVRARLGEEAAESARVFVDGERVGRTDGQGEATIRLPADPGTTVAVRTRDQTARTNLWGLYAGTAGVVTILGGVLVGFLGALALGGSRAASVGADAARSLPTLLARAVDLALALATRIERWLQRVEPWLRSVLSRIRRALRRPDASMLPDLFAWLRRVPGRLWRWLVGLLAWLRAAPRSAWAAVRESTGEAAESTGDDATTSAARPAGPTTLRERWRTFARWVVPEHWRRRTPGEVARAALEDGYPRDAVVELTRVFRDVEYGDRPLSPERDERTRRAFDALEAHQRDTRRVDGGATAHRDADGTDATRSDSRDAADAVDSTDAEEVHGQ